MNKAPGLTVLFVYLLLFGEVVFAQEISIANISQTKGFYETSIEISGSGFNASAANNEIWFGASKGTVVSSTANLLIATVPSGASVSAITVLNKSTGLSATSSKIFHEIYQGGTVDYTNLDFFSFPHSKKLLDLEIADLDNDGKNDLIASKEDATATKVITYRNVGTGSNIDFVEQEFSVGSPTSNVAIGDIDGDGKLDLVFARDGTSKNQIYVLKNTSSVGSISFAVPISYYLRTGQFAKSIAIRDLDLDGKPEVVVANSTDNEISIFVNQSSIGSVNLSTVPTRILTAGSKSIDIIIEDFDLDGKHDIAFTQVANDVIILPNQSSTGSLSFGASIILPINGSLNEIKAGDLNDDGMIDIIVTDPFGGNLSVALNESAGSISFGAAQTFNSGLGSASLALSDFTGNGLLDLFVTSNSGDKFTIFENTSSSGTLTLTEKLIDQANRSRVVVTGDLSNDSRPDIAFTANDIANTNFFLIAVRNTSCVEPTILGETTPTICNGQTYTFETPSVKGANFVWKKDGIEVLNSVVPSYTAATPGSYTVTVELDAATCSVTSAAIVLADNPGAITDPTAANNGPTCIDGSINLTASNIAGATYSWTGPNGFTSIDQNPVLTNVTAAMAGTYTVIAEISPCKSLPVNTIVEVINPPDLTVSLSGPANICIGESITLTVGAATGYTYQWSKDATPITGATNNTYAASDAGSYTVNLKGIANNCDLTSNTVSITTFSAPTPIFSSIGTLCEGSIITFTETTTLEPGKTPTYNWDFGDMTGTSIEANPTYTYSTAATYTVELIIGYQGHTCINPATTNDIIINAPTPFTIQATGDIPFCAGDSVLLEVPATGFTSATWSTNETGLSIYGKDVGTITATATNTAGCVSSSDIVLTTLPAPTITVTIDNEAIDSTTISIGQSAQLEASGADSYVWSPIEGLDDPNIANPIASPSVNTTYQVIGTALGGCSSAAELIINIEDTGDKLPVEAPRMFSPDNNGIDDEWVIGNIENFPDCEVVIFSRNGKIVYQDTGYQTNWRGIDINGNDLPEGAYFYTISCPDGKTASGSVSIIRE